jgi:hypothetical protein
MANAKEKMTEIIPQQPDDSSYDEILRELAFAKMVEKGLEDSRSGRTISDEEMRSRMARFLNSEPCSNLLGGTYG